MNTPVNFEIAKLLKEKGFVKVCENVYRSDGLLYTPSISGSKIMHSNILEDESFSAPTIAEVVMWLYEKHGIWIECKAPNLYHRVWYCLVVKINISTDYEHCSEEYQSPTEAYEAAIEYCLTKLL